jgi:hypothetical protein
MESLQKEVLKAKETLSAAQNAYDIQTEELQEEFRSARLAAASLAAKLERAGLSLSHRIELMRIGVNRCADV